MLKEKTIVFMCDVHRDDFAQALCRTHKKLLCLSCILKKAKFAECSLTELRKMSSPKDNLLVECLSVKQILTRKEQLIVEQENTTMALKDELEQAVIEMHDTVTKRLDEMKDNCLKSIDKQTHAITEVNECNKPRLLQLKSKINEGIDKLSAEVVGDITSIKIQLEEVKTEVMYKIPDMDTIPTGEFKPNDSLKEKIMQSGISLGNIYLIDPKRNDNLDKVSYCTRDRASVASDEILHTIEDDKPDYGEADEYTDEQSEAEIQSKPYIIEESTEASDKADTTSSETTLPDCMSDRKRRGILKWLSRDRWKSNISGGQEKKISTKDDQGKSSSENNIPSISMKASTKTMGSTFYLNLDAN